MSSRRTCLKGLGGAAAAGTFLTPLTSMLVGDAFAQSGGASDLRFLFISTTNGWWPERNWSLTDEPQDRSLSTAKVETTQLRFGPILSPLARHQDRLLFVDGLPQRRGEDGAGGNGHSKGSRLFSGGSFQQQTVDHYLASHLSQGLPFEWIGLMDQIIGSPDFLHQIGHMKVDDSEGKNERYQGWHSERLARLIDRLASLPTADGGTFLDKTVIVYLNDNGPRHHNGTALRFPVAIFGDGGGRLRADGRYIRLPMVTRWWEHNNAQMDATPHSLQQLWNTLAHVAGAPNDDFGVGSFEAQRGPNPDLMT